MLRWDRSTLLLMTVLLLLGLGFLGYGLFAPASPVVLEWATASEVSTAGFAVYRSEDPAGPYELLTDQLIPSNFDPVTGGVYEYQDRSVQKGRTYFYRLEEVEFDGTRQQSQETVSARTGRGEEWLLVGAVALVLAVVIVITKPRQTVEEA